MNRAYSVFEIKDLDDEQRVLTGIASTPSTDRMEDIVEPKGAVFKLPVPLLWQHDRLKPIGHVTAAKVTKEGIDITARLVKPYEGAPAAWVERLEVAWADIKTRLVRGFSIGFSPLESAEIEGTWGRRFTKWEWLELSPVTIPANADASIENIKSLDTAVRRGQGIKLLSADQVRKRSGAVALIGN